MLRKRWVNIEKIQFKIHTHKKKRDKYGEILNVIKKNNENNFTRKKPTKAQIMTVESSKANITIIHPRQRKKLSEQKMVEDNSKLLLSGKFDCDPEEILDKLLLFNLKKVKIKCFIQYSTKYQTKTIFIISNTEKE